MLWLHKWRDHIEGRRPRTACLFACDNLHSIRRALQFSYCSYADEIGTSATAEKRFPWATAPTPAAPRNLTKNQSLMQQMAATAKVPPARMQKQQMATMCASRNLDNTGSTDQYMGSLQKQQILLDRMRRRYQKHRTQAGGGQEYTQRLETLVPAEVPNPTTLEEQRRLLALKEALIRQHSDNNNKTTDTNFVSQPFQAREGIDQKQAIDSKSPSTIGASAIEDHSGGLNPHKQRILDGLRTTRQEEKAGTEGSPPRPVHPANDQKMMQQQRTIWFEQQQNVPSLVQQRHQMRKCPKCPGKILDDANNSASAAHVRIWTKSSQFGHVNPATLPPDIMKGLANHWSAKESPDPDMLGMIMPINQHTSQQRAQKPARRKLRIQSGSTQQLRYSREQAPSPEMWESSQLEAQQGQKRPGTGFDSVLDAQPLAKTMRLSDAYTISEDRTGELTERVKLCALGRS